MVDRHSNIQVPTPLELAALEDEALARLTVEWRAAALRGDKRAFGTAHALETERRRRLRDTEAQALEALPSPNQRVRWWRFWQRETV